MNQWPKAADKKHYESDSKGFFYKAKNTSLKSFDQFIKDLTEVEKEKIPKKNYKKIKEILESFDEKKFQEEHPIILHIWNWAKSVIEYYDQVKKAN